MIYVVFQYHMHMPPVLNFNINTVFPVISKDFFLI